MTPQTKPNPDNFGWPSSLIAEFKSAYDNARVGKVLVSETDRVRVWSLRLAPGERIGFHKHVLDYFWTAVTGGKAISRMDPARSLKPPMSPVQPCMKPLVQTNTRSTILRMLAKPS